MRQQSELRLWATGGGVCLACRNGSRLATALALKASASNCLGSLRAALGERGAAAICSGVQALGFQASFPGATYADRTQKFVGLKKGERLKRPSRWRGAHAVGQMVTHLAWTQWVVCTGVTGLRAGCFCGHSEQHPWPTIIDNSGRNRKLDCAPVTYPKSAQYTLICQTTPPWCSRQAALPRCHRSKVCGKPGRIQQTARHTSIHCSQGLSTEPFAALD